MLRRLIAAVLCVGVLAGAAATAEAARKYRSGVYRGETAQKAKLSLKVVKSKKAIMNFDWEGAVMGCSDGQNRQLNGFRSPDDVRFKLSKKGKFKIRVGGSEGAVEFNARGRIKKKKATGVIQLQALFNENDELDPQGSVLCDSELVTWTARHK